MSNKLSLVDYVRQELNNVKEIDQFKDRDEQKRFITKLQENKDYPADSIRLSYSSELKKRIKKEGRNENEFTKKQSKRYSSKLDINTDTEKVKVNTGDKSLDESIEDKSKMPKMQNPKLQTAQVQTIDNTTYESVGNAINTTIAAFVENMEELTDTEKESFGACLRMSFGDTIEGSAQAKMVLGLVGISGIVVGKVRKAKKITKKQKQTLELDHKSDTIPIDTKPKSKPVEIPKFDPTKEDLKAMEDNNKKFLRKQETDN